MNSTINTSHLQETVPTRCPFCEQEKEFLLMKPVAMLLGGQVHIYAGIIQDMKWICLDCLSMDINTLGHALDIYEYRINPTK